MKSSPVNCVNVVRPLLISECSPVLRLNALVTRAPAPYRVGMMEEKIINLKYLVFPVLVSALMRALRISVIISFVPKFIHARNSSFVRAYNLIIQQLL